MFYRVEKTKSEVDEETQKISFNFLCPHDTCVKNYAKARDLSAHIVNKH